VKLTGRLFVSKLGRAAAYFRRRYDIDEEPDTDRPSLLCVSIQQEATTIIGTRIDTTTGTSTSARHTYEIAQSALAQRRR